MTGNAHLNFRTFSQFCQYRSGVLNSDLRLAGDATTGLPTIMYKQYSHQGNYYGESSSKDVPILIMSHLPNGKPDPVEPEQFDDEKLDKVNMIQYIIHLNYDGNNNCMKYFNH
jgi:hypothetical protein